MALCFTSACDFKCDVERCIASRYLCDGKYECADRQDEENCGKRIIIEFFRTKFLRVNNRKLSDSIRLQLTYIA